MSVLGGIKAAGNVGPQGPAGPSATLSVYTLDQLTQSATISTSAEILLRDGTNDVNTTVGLLANAISGLTGAGRNISFSIGAQSAAPFTVSGTLTNYGTTTPTLSYADNGGALTAIGVANSGTISSSAFSFTHPALGISPTNWTTIVDGNGLMARSAYYAVTGNTASFANVPSTSTAGTAITGVTITANFSPVYVVPNNGTADVGSRVSTTGTAVAGFTIGTAGTYTLDAYAASSGGSPVATSGNIVIQAGTSSHALHLVGTTESASTPTTTAMANIGTQDITATIVATPTAWTSSAGQALWASYDTSQQLSLSYSNWMFSVNSSGYLQFDWLDNADYHRTVTSSATVPGGTTGVKVASNRGSSQMTFSVSSGGTYSTLGTVQTMDTTFPFSTTTPNNYGTPTAATIGNSRDLARPFVGAITSVVWQVGTTTAANVSFASASIGATTVAGADGNTYTINNGASIY